MTEIEVVDERIEAIADRHDVMRQRAGKFKFVEGPVWHAKRRVLIFSDIPADRLYEFDPDADQTKVYREPSYHANGNTLDGEHRLITCQHATGKVVREEADGSITTIAAEYEGAELNSPNDVVVDAQGRILFTDPQFGRTGRQPVNGVYRVDPATGVIQRLVDDCEGPNGLCLAEDGRVLYVNDSLRMHIRRFELTDDGVSAGQVWATLRGEDPGAPDGMKIDRDGNVYSCGPGGLHVFDPTGTHLGVIRTPEPVANFTWGDDDRQTLYLTATSSLYALRVRIPGAAVA